MTGSRAELPRWLTPAVDRFFPWASTSFPEGMNKVERNPASALQVDVSWDGVVATVMVTGELDITTATSLTRRLLEVGAAHPDKLVLDLSGLVVVDVAGARALDEAHTLLQAECPVILRTPRPSARKYLGLAGRIEGQNGAGFSLDKQLIPGIPDHRHAVTSELPRGVEA